MFIGVVDVGSSALRLLADSSDDREEPAFEWVGADKLRGREEGFVTRGCGQWRHLNGR